LQQLTTCAQQRPRCSESPNSEKIRSVTRRTGLGVRTSLDLMMPPGHAWTRWTRLDKGPCPGPALGANVVSCQSLSWLPTMAVGHTKYHWFPQSPAKDQGTLTRGIFRTKWTVWTELEPALLDALPLTFLWGFPDGDLKGMF